MDKTLRIVTQEEEFEALSAIGDEILQRSGDDSAIYLTHEWMSTWWKHFGEGKKLHILVIEKDERIIGIIPLMRIDYKMGPFKYRFIETIGSVNCNYIGIVPCEEREEVVETFLTYLEEALNEGLILRLTMVPDDSKFLDLLHKHSPGFTKRNLSVRERPVTIAPYISLPESWEEYFSSLSQNRRWYLRRKPRILEKLYNYDLKECNVTEVQERVTEFISLHQRRWKSVNVSGLFADLRMEGFFRELSTKFTERGWLHFSLILLDGKMVSAEYAYIYNQRLYAAISARDPEYSKYGVGHVHVMSLIKHAVESGLRELDFLRGDEPYKFRWTRSARKYNQVMIVNKSRCWRLRLKLIYLFLRIYIAKRYSPVEIYHIFRIRRRERRERQDMGVPELLK